MVQSARAWFLGLIVFATLALGQRPGQAAEMRFALVIGDDQYRTGKLATPVNDAGLIANALQSAGFTVTGASNLDQATLRESFREFLNEVAAAGPDAVALVYLAGHGLQFEGENYFVPVDANIQHETDVPLQAIRLSDFTQALAALPGHVKLVILDAARQNPFPHGSEPLASGLALVEPAPSMAIAFNAAPGTVAPDEPGPYGAYATSITEMIADGGLTLDDLFARVRLRVSDLTKGTEIPWYAFQITTPFFMTERIAGAPPPANVMPLADIRHRPFREFGSPDDAYAAALALDTVEGYEQFLAIYPDGPYSRRIAAMLAIRREEIVWRRCFIADTPPAYWSYLRRYPNGPHVWDARRRLAMLSAAYEPPPGFVMLDFGFPPPASYELAFIDRPIVVFEGPGLAPPPPPPLFFLPPRPHEFATLPPPPPSPGRFILPVIAAAAVPAFIRPPQNVAPRPVPPAVPGGRPAMTVALPAAVQAASGVGTPPAPGLPGLHGPAAVNPAIPQTNQAAPPSPATAAIKPSPLPHALPTTPAMVQPAPPPPTPPSSTVPKRAFIQPSPPPPPPATTTPKPAFVKPSPPPPSPTAPKPAFVKPPALPPPPSGTPPHPPTPVAAKPAPPAKPACPPGKTLTPQGCK